MGILKALADHRNDASPAAWMRRRRFALFTRLLSAVPRPLRILDVGGTMGFWKSMRFESQPGIRIVILNKTQGIAEPESIFETQIGDARFMDQFGKGEFDVVFSNSVIEHVGGAEDQLAMAKEVRRVGRRYFVQTPNLYFPIEPHFLFPGFQFLSVDLRVAILTRVPLGWYGRVRDAGAAREIVTSIRLLDEGRMRDLFPDAALHRERFLGLTKSFIAYGGFQASP